MALCRVQQKCDRNIVLWCLTQLTVSQNVEIGDQHVACRTEHDDKNHKQNDHPVLWFSYCRKEEVSSKTKRWSMGRYIGWELSTVY